MELKYRAKVSQSLLGKSLRKFKKCFTANFLQVKTQTPDMLLLYESRSLPIEVLGMERVVEYMLKMRQNPSHWLPTIAWGASKKVQKTHKSKILSTRRMQDTNKWFGRWDASHLLHDASTDSQVNEAYLQHQCITAWEEAGGSRFIHYTTHIAPNYKKHVLRKRRTPYPHLHA